MAFPEGQRSPDGRLMDFKGGIFAMATKAKVPIVPISLSHTHAVMPANSFFPVQPGNGKLRVHIHKPIDPAGKTEDELVALVREALLSEMPEDQHPYPKIASPDDVIEEKKLDPSPVA
jgi:1-acyl-sn-glycerol-3-phosphate acyltransferase